MSHRFGSVGRATTAWSQESGIRLRAAQAVFKVEVQYSQRIELEEWLRILQGRLEMLAEPAITRQ